MPPLDLLFAIFGAACLTQRARSGPSVLFSLAEAPIQNFTLSNVTWTAAKGVRAGYEVCAGNAGPTPHTIVSRACCADVAAPATHNETARMSTCLTAVHRMEIEKSGGRNVCDRSGDRSSAAAANQLQLLAPWLDRSRLSYCCWSRTIGVSYSASINRCHHR